MGGWGTKRTPRLAARYAASSTCRSCDRRLSATGAAKVHAACEAAGRDPATLRLSVGLGLAVGEEAADVRRRREFLPGEGPFLEGTPEQVAEQLAGYRDAGAYRAYLQLFDLRDLEQLRLVGERVGPLLSSS